MSDETFAALEAALKAHVADAENEGALLTDWIVTAACVGGFAGTGYMHLSAKGTAPHSLFGLSVVTQRHYEEVWDADMGDDDDE